MHQSTHIQPQFDRIRYERSTSTVSKTFTTPGWRRVRNLRSAFRARGNRDLFADTSKENILHLDPSSWNVELVTRLDVQGSLGHTRFVPLYKVQIESSISTRSPKVYPNAGPLDMADATADLRKSMDPGAEAELRVKSKG